VLVGFVGLARGHTLQHADIRIAVIEKGDMGGLVRKQACVFFGNQQQRDIVFVQQVLIDLTREIVGEGH
jgi:hypothetical protein